MIGLRLGFHYHVPAILRDGHIYMPGYFGRFIDSLGEHCGQVVCFLPTPRPTELVYMDYPILSSNVNLVSIGPHASIPYQILFFWRYMRAVRKKCTSLDAFLIRGPTPLLPVMVSSIRPLPTALLLVGDYLSGVDDLPQPRWRKEIIRLWSWWNKQAQTRAARQNLTFVNSHKLYNELKPVVFNLIEIRTTTLRKNDFYERENTCLHPPYHLLYTGRMDRSKGLFEIVEAMVILVAQGKDVILDLVGWAEIGDHVIEELQAFANQKGVKDRLKYHGYKPVGPELFAFYKQADIYIIASKSSFEGFPRTIWEAMAHSLPVVATQVGSIPSFVSDAAELVQPRDATALADAVSFLICEPEWRKRMISRGRELVQSCTLETQVGRMMTEIKYWLGDL